MMEFVSWDYDIPKINGNAKLHGSSHHQPVIQLLGLGNPMKPLLAGDFRSATQDPQKCAIGIADDRLMAPLPWDKNGMTAGDEIFRSWCKSKKVEM